MPPLFKVNFYFLKFSFKICTWIYESIINIYIIWISQSILGDDRHLKKGLAIRQNNAMLFVHMLKLRYICEQRLCLVCLSDLFHASATLEVCVAGDNLTRHETLGLSHSVRAADVLNARWCPQCGSFSHTPFLQRWKNDDICHTQYHLVSVIYLSFFPTSTTLFKLYFNIKNKETHCWKI